MEETWGYTLTGPFIDGEEYVGEFDSEEDAEMAVTERIEEIMDENDLDDDTEFDYDIRPE